jgi:hypothetical protein
MKITNKREVNSDTISNKLLNSDVLKLQQLRFTANYQDAKIAFRGWNPVETSHVDQLAIQCGLPNVLLIYHGSERPVIPRLPLPSLRCIANEGGFLSFESNLVDSRIDLYDKVLNIQ